MSAKPDDWMPTETGAGRKKTTPSCRRWITSPPPFRSKRLPTAVDTPGPENERQARRLDAHGNGRRPEEDDPIMQAMDYVATAFGRLPPSEQREFISSLRDLLTELAQGLDRQAPAPAMA